MIPRERFLNVMEYQPVDRVANWELGCWGQTIDRWQAEGAPWILSLAWRRAQDQIASSDYRLPDAESAEVERVYQRAVAHKGSGASRPHRGDTPAHG